MMVPRLRLAHLLAGLTAGAALFAALASEWWGGLVPCALCLVERWPYRIVIGLGLLAAITPRGLSRLLLNDHASSKPPATHASFRQPPMMPSSSASMASIHSRREGSTRDASHRMRRTDADAASRSRNRSIRPNRWPRRGGVAAPIVTLWLRRGAPVPRGLPPR